MCNFIRNNLIILCLTILGITINFIKCNFMELCHSNIGVILSFCFLILSLPSNNCSPLFSPCMTIFASVYCIFVHLMLLHNKIYIVCNKINVKTPNDFQGKIYLNILFGFQVVWVLGTMLCVCVYVCIYAMQSITI